jgi:hypothetical protein
MAWRCSFAAQLQAIAILYSFNNFTQGAAEIEMVHGVDIASAKRRRRNARGGTWKDARSDDIAGTGWSGDRIAQRSRHQYPLTANEGTRVTQHLNLASDKDYVISRACIGLVE